MSHDPIQDLLADLSKELTTYPVIQDGYNLAHRTWIPDPPILDRKQIEVGPGRYAMLIRHPVMHHWNGYVRIKEEDWDRIRDKVQSIANARVDYEGPNSQYIAWMHPTQDGRLTLPLGITDNDFWVGFSTLRHQADEPIGIETALENLYGFENLVYSLASGRLNVSSDHSDF
jgi:hypothetical protein